MRTVSCVETKGIEKQECLAYIKCQYKDTQLKCEYCVGKGLGCGPKISAKSWQSDYSTQLASKMRTPPIFTPQLPLARSKEEQLIPLEERYITPIRDGRSLFSFTQLQACRTDQGRLYACVFRRFGPSLSSPVIRFGCVLYSMSKRGDAKAFDISHLMYLDKFYTAMRRAIDQQSFIEVAYGSFIAVMYSLKQHRPFSEITNHAKAFRLSVHQLMTSMGIVNEETFLLECMWEKINWRLGSRLVVEAQSDTDVELCQLMDFAKPLALSDYSFSSWMPESLREIDVKFQFLRLIISLEMQHCLAAQRDPKINSIGVFERGYDKFRFESLEKDVVQSAQILSQPF